MITRRSILDNAVVGGSALLISGLPGASALAHAAASEQPAVTGPVKGGKHGWPFGAYFGDLGSKGYVEEEFFLSGVAKRFEPVGELTPDGRWTLKPAGEAPYKTRILVRRPKDPRKFNGTVILEWANVTAGYEIAFADPAGIYDGFAYVQVSAQRVGVHGFAKDPVGLLQWDPERYGTLTIADDAYSYDIFTQAARVVRAGARPGGVDPLGGLKARKLIAIGGSQSGTRLLGYTNGVQPLEKAFDAIIPVVWAGAATDFSLASPDGNGRGRSVLSTIRDDLGVPVLGVNSETEAEFYFPRRQPDTDLFRYWEVAGASHAPTGQTRLIRERTSRDGVGGPGAGGGHASDVEWLATVDAGIGHVHKWLHGGPPPPRQTPITFAGAPPTIARDQYGNALGGVRLPELEAPIARYRGSEPGVRLAGRTFPFTAEQLHQLYPSHDDYVRQVQAAAERARKAGVIPPYRVAEYVAQAKAAPVPG